MNETPPEQIFRALRPRLLRLAYRMLGSVADAEDIVQDAWMRWLASEREAVREPAAFLHVVVTRLALNELKSARRRRETYIGPWLPDPITDPGESGFADELTLPLMMALERLSPLERVAFLLHDVFGLDFDEIAVTIARKPASCRKLASRARLHVQAAKPRFAVTPQRGREIAAAFFQASRDGDIAGLRALLAEDVSACADGGGKVAASAQILTGRDAVLARHAEMAEGFARSPSRLLRHAVIDGLAGFISSEGNVLQTTALAIDHGRIVAIYVTRNPDKLAHLPEAASSDGQAGF